MRLKQVFLNILSNALKYNVEGGKIIIANETRHDWLRVSISDTGKGIREENVPKLFEPFERLGYEGSHIEGTGIGLTITKKIIDLLGAKIGVESKEGEGSLFWVELPISEKRARH